MIRPLRSVHGAPVTSERRSLHLLPDPELIAICLTGDARAWDTLLARYQALIYTVGIRTGLAPMEAEDVLQDVCLLLLKHLEDVRDRTRLSRWLIATTRREAVRMRRKRDPALMLESETDRLQWEQGLTLGISPTTTPEESVLALEEQQLLREALDKLGGNCKDLISLLYFQNEEYSYNEIAALLKMSVGSVGPTRARCLKKLEKILGAMGF